MSSTTQPAAVVASRPRRRLARLGRSQARSARSISGWAGLFFVIAGILTLLMRLQMTRPDASILGNRTYRGVLTMHGTLLVFFVLVPVVTGLATFLVPLMIGAGGSRCPDSPRWRSGSSSSPAPQSSSPPSRTEDRRRRAGPGIRRSSLDAAGNGVGLWLIGLCCSRSRCSLSAANLVATIRSLRTDGMTWRTCRCSCGRSTSGRG